MSTRPNIFVFALIAGICAFATASLAQTTSQVYGDTLTKQTQTFFVEGESDWTTYNSKAVDSNTTGMTSAYSIGGYSGEKRVLGVFLTSTNQDLKFDLNNSRVRSNWSDLRMEARLGYIYPSVGASLSEIKMEKEETTVVDAVGRGVNAGIAVRIPATPWMVLNTEAMVAKTQAARDKDGREIELGLRQEAEINASFDITKNFIDFLVGYRMRSFDMKVDDEEYKEKQSAPFAGLRVGAYF